MRIADRASEFIGEPAPAIWFPASSVRDVDAVLRSLRAHLGMDVAFVSEFVGDSRVIRHLDARSYPAPLKAGDTVPLDKGYCKKVTDGVLPQLIPDTSKVPEAVAIPETHTMPIGAHLSVPLRLADGQLYGTFCCFSFEPDPSLGRRDLQTMTAFAATLAHKLDEDLAANREREEKTNRIKSLLKSSEPTIVFQPIFRLADMQLNGAEALARFKSEPYRTPDQWFADAAAIGIRTELELKAMGNAITAFASAWARRPLYLGLNSSPRTLLDEGLRRVLQDAPLNRLVIEITEHEPVDDYEALNSALKPLREAGVKIAIDDAGSGYSSMRHILSIEPDIIKLDISLTRTIDRDAKSRALAAALIAFGCEVGCRVVAEGVETEGVLTVLRELGVDAAQGYHLGRPMVLDDYMALLNQAIA